MASGRGVSPVKLFVGMLGSDADLLRRAAHLLSQQYGPVDFASELWPFDETDYYEPEMGPDLKRRFVSFQDLIQPDRIAEIKRESYEIERQLADDTLAAIPRPVNLDPGYLDLSKLVLATTKDASHRVYLGAGIFAEVTLRYARGGWQLLPWTYPDFRKDEYHELFRKLRERYRSQRQALMNTQTHPDGELL